MTDIRYTDCSDIIVLRIYNLNIFYSHTVEEFDNHSSRLNKILVIYVINILNDVLCTLL